VILVEAVVLVLVATPDRIVAPVREVALAKGVGPAKGVVQGIDPKTKQKKSRAAVEILKRERPLMRREGVPQKTTL